MKRRDDNYNKSFSTHRVFCCNGDWYFLTRESPQIGPFESRDDMDDVLDQYIEERTHVKTYTISLMDFDWSEASH